MHHAISQMHDEHHGPGDRRPRAGPLAGQIGVEVGGGGRGLIGVVAAGRDLGRGRAPQFGGHDDPFRRRVLRVAGGERERVLEGLGVVVEVPVVVAQHFDLVGGHDDRLSHFVDEAALDGGHDHFVAGMELVDVVERLAVGGAVPGQGGVALLSGPRRLGVMAGALLEVAHRDPLDEGPVQVDGRDFDPAGILAGGRDELGRQGGDGLGRRPACGCGRAGVGVAHDGAGGGRGVESGGEVAVEAPLGLGGADARAPQLIGDEQQDQHTGRDQYAAGDAEDSGQHESPGGALAHWRHGSEARGPVSRQARWRIRPIRDPSW